VLAYVFWHRPGDDVARSDYEERLRAFHDKLETPSASFRLHALPWKPVDGYEDWYLAEDWAALGALNEAALAAPRRAEHDAAAAASIAGWGGVYRLIDGAAEPPEAVRWAHERGEAQAVWQRQMVLGPAPEFCLAGGPPRGRERVA
jgi:hypothetical protein